jgi:hypothetical protein
MTDTIERLVRMLDEERKEVETAKRDRLEANRQTMRENASRGRVERDLRCAEEKIDEWIAYAGRLANMLRQRKVLEEKIGRAPTPFAREIPF